MRSPHRHHQVQLTINANSFAERFKRSIKAECLGRTVFFGQASLRHALQHYMAHYHAERNHQGLGTDCCNPFPSLCYCIVLSSSDSDWEECSSTTIARQPNSLRFCFWTLRPLDSSGSYRPTATPPRFRSTHADPPLARFPHNRAGLRRPSGPFPLQNLHPYFERLRSRAAHRYSRRERAMPGEPHCDMPRRWHACSTRTDWPSCRDGLV